MTKNEKPDPNKPYYKYLERIEEISNQHDARKKKINQEVERGFIFFSIFLVITWALLLFLLEGN